MSSSEVQYFWGQCAVIELPDLVVFPLSRPLLWITTKQRHVSWNPHFHKPVLSLPKYFHMWKNRCPLSLLLSGFPPWFTWRIVLNFCVQL